MLNVSEIYAQGFIVKIEKIDDKYSISYQYQKKQFKIFDFSKQNLESIIWCIDRLISQPFLHRIDNQELIRLNNNLEFLKQAL